MTLIQRGISVINRTLFAYLFVSLTLWFLQISCHAMQAPSLQNPPSQGKLIYFSFTKKNPYEWPGLRPLLAQKLQDIHHKNKVQAAQALRTLSQGNGLQKNNHKT